jgi:solute carrier family 30 (zinc transporter), member 5/7
MLTSLILLVLGAYGKYSRQNSLSYNARSGLGVAEDTKKASAISLDIRTASRIARRSIGILLPFIATLQLGGLGVSVLLLISVASGLLPLNKECFDLSVFQGWKHLLRQKIWTLTYSVLLCLAAAQYVSDSRLSSVTGILTVVWFTFFCGPPYLVEAAHESSFISPLPSAKSTSAVPSIPWDAAEPTYPVAGRKLSSPLIASTEETSLTLLSGVITAAAAGVFYLFGDFSIMAPESAAVMLLVSLVSVYSLSGWDMSIFIATPIPLATGLAAAILGNALMLSNFQTLWQDTIIGAMAYTAVQLDSAKSETSIHAHTHSSNEKQTQHRSRNFSAPTKVLLQSTQNYSLLHGILADKESRRIFYFMLLNLSFMLVQSTYGVLTGSLGLISDSIHMFFDCFALLVGLCAAVMSKWPPSVKYPYGFGKLDTLAGFGNGIFLMLISIEIIWEAVERLVEGSDVSRTMELLVVSSLGLGVNLVGIMAFDHGHAHGHGGHDHSHAGHSHSHTNHSHTPSDHPASAAPSVAKPEHTHHHHGGDNMYGIYLHIMADALGSVAVVISTLCVRYTGWSGFDPLASCAIAILIFASAVPLVFSSGKKLLLSLPGDVEYALRDVLAGVSTIRGVVGYTVPKFWLDDVGRKDEAHGHDQHDHQQHDHHHHEKSSDHHQHHDEDEHDHEHSHPHHHHKHGHSADSHHGESEKQNQAVLGVIHVVASRHADLNDVRGRVSDYLRSKNMDIVVQVERYGDVKCWCGNGQKGC